jgi:DNA-binding transcriptional MerR regulator
VQPAETQDPGLTVAVVARRLGMAPATLRTWARRYGLGPSGHQAGLHRRYTEADVQRLAQVRRLILEGQSPAEAALAIAGTPSPTPLRHGGGRMIPLPADDVARGLAHAAFALDHEGIRDLLHRELDTRGTVALWQEVVVPVLVSLGERWQSTGGEIEVEHTVSECLIEVFSERSRAIDDPINATPVLLASADEEQHALPHNARAFAGSARDQVFNRC